MTEIRIPDIGGATDVDVIEIAVAPGDNIEQEQTLITLETDKASMEIPSPEAGVVDSIALRVGDKVAEGTVILTLVAAAADAKAETPTVTPESTLAPAPAPAPVVASSQVIPVVIPDIGTDAEVDIIAVEVAVGDSVAAEQTLITLEGEKATMDIPAPQAGIVTSIEVAVGDKTSQGKSIMQLEVTVAAATVAAPAAPSPAAAAPAKASTAAPMIDTSPVVQRGVFYAGPAVRRFARELGVDLSRVKGSAAKGRIIRQDVQNYVKAQMQAINSGAAVGGGLAVADAPKVDFAKFGEIEYQSLNKIKRLTASNLHRNWVTIPHVTQFDEADITDLEAFRKQNKHEAESKGFKLTPLVFIMKAVAAALAEFPSVNASLSADGQQLILKKYYHIGVAVDTPNGLVVAVVRDVDQKSLLTLADELGQISEKARTKGLAPADMQGSCFTISSLGGIGGTAFTPIVNFPDVAILGVSRSQHKPVYQGGEFVPRLMLPLSLSYDHRVIDGAEAARFSRYVVERLADVGLLAL